MMPPICEFCNKRFQSRTGKLLHFKISDDEKTFNLRFREHGFVGHKKGAHWFCEDHVTQAKTLTHLSIRDAIDEIKRSKSL